MRNKKEKRPHYDESFIINTKRLNTKDNILEEESHKLYKILRKKNKSFTIYNEKRNIKNKKNKKNKIKWIII